MILIPVKNLAFAKQRLAPVLDQTRRTELAHAIQQAVTSGVVAASPPTSLFHSEPSLIVFKAVYQGRYMPRTAAERQTLLQGLMALELPSQFISDLLIPYPAFDVELVYLGKPLT